MVFGSRPGGQGKPGDAPGESWGDARGVEQADLTADLRGSFPGSLLVGGALTHVSVVLTNRYLLVDEGAPHGFMIPVRSLVAGVDDRHGDPVIHAWFMADGRQHYLAIIPTGPRLIGRTAQRAARFQAKLEKLGLTDSTLMQDDPATLFDAAFSVPRDLLDENVIWSGDVYAPSGPGLAPAPGRAWLTTRALVWGMPGDGVMSRVSLPALIDATISPVRIPTVMLGIRDSAGIRYEIPVGFTSADPSLDERERNAFLAALRARHVREGRPLEPLQGWAIAAGSASAAGRDIGWMTWPGGVAPEPGDPAVAEDATAPAGTIEPVVPEPATEPAPFPVAEPAPDVVHGPPTLLPEGDEIELAWKAITLYEVDTMLALRNVLEAISGRGDGVRVAIQHRVPPADEQRAAMIGLETLYRSGVFDMQEWHARRSRLNQVSEAAIRLRTLLDLHDADHLSTLDLLARRASIVATLEDILPHEGN